MSTLLTPREMAELKQSVSDAVAKPERLMDVVELAQALNMSPATVERRIRAGLIPVIRNGGRLRRFRLSSVLKALEGE